MQSFGALRQIHDDELELMLKWRNSPSVRENMYTRHEILLDEHMAWWEKTKNRDDQQYFMYETMGKPLGIVGFNSIDKVNQHAFWAFYASPEAPHGTGTFMEYTALEHAFFELRLHKLSCEVLEFNSSVIKLHQKFGFAVEGVFRLHHKIDDIFANIYRLAILNTEWHAHRDLMRNRLEKLIRK